MELNKHSEKCLKTCKDDLKMVIEKAAENTPFPFQVRQGSISVDLQQKSFNRRGAKINPEKFVISKPDAKTIKYSEDFYERAPFVTYGKKEYGKSRAVMLSGGSAMEMAVVAGHVLSIANTMRNNGDIDSIIVCEGLKGGVASSNTEALSTFIIEKTVDE